MSFQLDLVGYCGLSPETWDVLWEHPRVSWPVSTEGSWAFGASKRGFAFSTRTLRASEGMFADLATPAGNADLIDV